MEYNKPMEVTEGQYKKLMTKCAGIVAGRVVQGQYFIKLMIVKYRKYVIDNL